MTEPLVTIDGLRVSYRGKQVSSMPHLELHPGSMVALVGESGSGKSTVLMAILGLLSPSAQIEGSITVGGVQMVGADDRQAREVRGSQVALVMQSPQGSLNPTMRLRTLARRALKRHGVHAG